MRHLLAPLLALLTLCVSQSAFAQIPGTDIVIGRTPVVGGVNGDCLTVSGGKLSQTAACGATSGLTVGTSTIAGGTTTRILYDNAGVLGEYTLSGIGTAVAMAKQPVLYDGSNVARLTVQSNGSILLTPGDDMGSGGTFTSATDINIWPAGSIYISAGTTALFEAVGDVGFSSTGAAVAFVGATGLTFSTAAGGISLTAGTNEDVNIIAPRNVNLRSTGSTVVGVGALATNATDGFLYIPTSAGTPTGVPTANTGRVALIYDTTNKQFWIYDGGWKQPKTPAAAAIVTWQ